MARLISYMSHVFTLVHISISLSFNKYHARYFLLFTRYFANYTDRLIDKLPHVGKSHCFDSVTLTNAFSIPSSISLETMQEIRLNTHRSDYWTELASTHGERHSTFIIYATRCRGHYDRSFSPMTRSRLFKLRFNDTTISQAISFTIGGSKIARNDPKYV